MLVSCLLLRYNCEGQMHLGLEEGRERENERAAATVQNVRWIKSQETKG